MRTLKILLVLVAVILSGFSRDSQTNENVFLKKRTGAEVVVPLKYWGGTIPDLSSGRTPCTPEAYGASIVSAGWLQGHQTHGGKLIPELSTWEIPSCTFTGTESISQCTGTITVANGDSYNFSAIMVINPFTTVVTANVTINDGVGRFEGVTGQMTLNGTLGSGAVVTWSGEGFLIFPK